jgi:hypothetical protein
VEKLILLSIIFVSAGVPIALSGSRSPRRALRRAQWIALAFVLVWAYMCIAWYPQLVPLD